MEGSATNGTGIIPAPRFRDQQRRGQEDGKSQRPEEDMTITPVL